jgi:hypothetical protein
LIWQGYIHCGHNGFLCNQILELLYGNLCQLSIIANIL